MVAVAAASYSTIARAAETSLDAYPQASGEFEAKSSAPKYQKGMTGYVDNKNDA